MSLSRGRTKKPGVGEGGGGREIDRLCQAVMKISGSTGATKMHVQDVGICIVAQTVCVELHHVEFSQVIPVVAWSLTNKAKQVVICWLLEQDTRSVMDCI